MSMEPIMKEKRTSADLVPYRKEGGRWFFYLQKRDASAPRAPNKIALFGGGIEEGETIETALKREIREELNYAPNGPIYFSRYETARNIAHIFIEEVDADFEGKVKVSEGEYGIFLSNEEVRVHSDVTPFAKLVVFHIWEFLTA